MHFNLRVVGLVVLFFFFFLLLDVRLFSQFFSHCFCVVVANDCLTGMERL